MKIFLDTEFTGLHQQTTLISLGMFTEKGNYFYVEFTNYNKKQAQSAWLKDNVFAHLSGNKLPKALDLQNGKNVICRGKKSEVVVVLRNWIGQFDEPIHIWADVPAWDWILFCDLMGGNLPDSVHYIVRDLATYLESKGYDPDISRESLAIVDLKFADLNLTKHHALYDAILEFKIYQKVSSDK